MQSGGLGPEDAQVAGEAGWFVGVGAPPEFVVAVDDLRVPEHTGEARRRLVEDPGLGHRRGDAVDGRVLDRDQDLRHALDGGLDKLIIDAIAASGFSAPGSDPLPTSVRKAISVVQTAGYNPNVLILTPAAAEALDTLVSGVSGATADYVFAPAQFAPQTIFGLQVRISKSIAAPAVADSTAFGKLYVSPITLSSHEEDAGATNKSTVRLEGHAAFGVERQAAAVRISAS